MDRVRLGRALGYGTRHAAKTVAAVVEAATAPDPRASTTQTTTAPSTSRDAASGARPSSRPSDRPAPQVAVPNVRAGARQFKRSFWQPLATFSGALWLRVTGLFFALIAITMGSGVWRMRHDLHPGNPIAHRLWVFLGFALLFGYFAVSSFVRASLKERRAASNAR